MRLTKFNPETREYEYIKKAKTQEEFMAQRKAVIQRLGEYEDKASDVAEEIFAEIEKLRPITKLVIKDLGEWDFDKYGEKFYWLSETKIAELKKKYTEEGK